MARDRDPELDNLCIAYIRKSRMRVVTRHAAMLRAMQIRFTYKHMTWEKGKPRFEPVPCFDIERVGNNLHYHMGVGFLPKIGELAEGLQVPLEVVNVETGKHEEVLRTTPLKMSISKQAWAGHRDWQKKAIAFVRWSRRGVFHTATGSGKSWLIVALCKYLKDYRILVTAKSSQHA